MCSTCDYRRFEPYEVVSHGQPIIIDGKPVVRLRNPVQSIPIHCDRTGRNYKFGDFTIYFCPTCGKNLFRR